MKIRVRSFAMIRESLGSKDISIDIDAGATVADAIYFIANKFSQSKLQLYHEAKINSNFILIVNDEKLDPTDYTSFKLVENDNLVILPPAGGG